MNILCVPIKVDALVADSTIQAVTTKDQYTRLPYVDENNTTINTQTANLSSSITVKPFDNYYNLEPGIHLHWKLPDMLLHGKREGNQLSMPSVPNRWLVIRKHKSDPDKGKQWVVESDYLHPVGSKPNRAICIPNTIAKSESTTLPPYRYLGRQVTLEEWNEEAKTGHDYLPSLNGLGWGNPYFSALYTDCYSVFGAYDDELSGRETKNYNYEVYGWYADKSDDYVYNILNKDGADIAKNAAELSDLINSTDGLTKQTGMLCYGKVCFSTMEAHYQEDGIDLSKTSITLAKSPYEAAAAFIANEFNDSEGVDGSKLQLENQIQSLLFNDDTSGKNIDFVDHLKQARHKNEFTPVTSGKLYEYVDESGLFDDSTLTIDEKNNIKAVFSTFKKKQQSSLNRLNTLKEQLNTIQLSCRHYTRLLYNDWSKYMLRLHPGEYAALSDVDPQIVRLLIERNTLPQLEAYQDRANQLEEEVNTLEASIKQVYTDSMSSVDSNKKTCDQLGVVKNPLLLVPGSRYWQPSNPSLLIAGDVAKQTTDVPLYADDEKLKCQLVNTGSDTLKSWLVKADNTAALYSEGLAVNTWGKQPWSPLMIEWKVNVYPDSRTFSSGKVGESNYDEEFISSNYRIPLNDGEYGLPSAGIDLMLNNLSEAVTPQKESTTVKGRSLLTFSGKSPIEKKIHKYLSSQSKSSDNTVFNNIKRLITKFEESHCMMPVLEGFHEKLLMYSNDTMLVADDPSKFSPSLGFEDNITDRVREQLNNKNFKLPYPDDHFLPIKSGSTKVNVVEVIDTFGRFKALDCGLINRPETSTRNNELYTPPRLVQPSRLMFRWKNVNASDDSMSSPICGWLCYNHFDDSLVIYSADGTHYGAINPDGLWVDRYGAQTRLTNPKSVDLNKFVTKALSFHNKNRIEKNLIIRQSSQKVWDELVKSGILHPYGDETKAYLKPVQKQDWPTDLEKNFEDGQQLIEASSTTVNYLPQFKKAILRSQDNIEPLQTQLSSSGMPYKPLAIVKASINLQLLGESEVNKSFDAINYDLKNNQRNNRGFTKVKFPVKLGEYNNLDDGLVAYWPEQDNAALSQRGYFPQSDMSDAGNYIDGASFNTAENSDDHSINDYIDNTKSQGVDNLQLSIEKRATSLLLLMDPQCAVHATSGILPKKRLLIDPTVYKDVLEKMQPDYFAAPILTPKNDLSIPLPLEKGWCWQQIKSRPVNKGGDDKETYIESTLSLKVADKSRFINYFDASQDAETITEEVLSARESDWNKLIASSYLKPKTDNQDHAYYHQGELKENDYTCSIEEVSKCLQASFLPEIMPAQGLPALDNKVQIIEGWLKPIHLA
ncbi:hypothetical protein EDC56_2800 [Sinobacterium caligoides]|uniref:Uncharacterized protein n=1 Tax=Sinobacterium caligoides TaxID=933926 RepID=A0A3N2DK32_9GAMM|nr:hypothetical protein [Sinobacterium caligoides]ROS00164.1 hypothetical protein EDC56_2800 [Sinobacterium caligoides]